MKKIILFVLVFMTITVFLCSCTASFPTKENVVALTSEEAAELLKDKTEKEIHDNWGVPDSYFSGLYGNIYLYNEKCIGIYYDYDSKVITNVVVFDKQN